MIDEIPVAEWQYSKYMSAGPVTDKRELTPDEIYQAAMSEWLETLSGLWAAYGKTPDAKQLAIYASVLGDVPQGLLEEAIQRVVGRHEYSNVPTAAEVKRAVWEILGKPYDLAAAIEVWGDRRFERCVVRFGSERSNP